MSSAKRVNEAPSKLRVRFDGTFLRPRCWRGSRGDTVRRDRSGLVRFAMFAMSSLKTISVWERASSPAMWDARISAILRLAALAALVGLLLGALAFGLWVGMSWSTDLSGANRGVMDHSY